jgi:hypothetical protein
MSRSFVSAPAIHLDRDVAITARQRLGNHGVVVRFDLDPYTLLGDLYLSTDAATLLRDVLTAALEDAPGTSKPAGAA